MKQRLGLRLGLSTADEWVRLGLNYRAGHKTIRPLISRVRIRHSSQIVEVGAKPVARA